MANSQNRSPRPKGPGLMSVLTPYRGIIGLLVVLTLGSNGLSLIIPLLIARSIDTYVQGNFDLWVTLWEFLAAASAILLLMFLQSIVQVRASERVARDLRNQVAHKISEQSFQSIQDANPAKLLTNLTADIDSIKMFVSHAMVMMISSLVTIIGTTILLIYLQWQLALVVLLMIPLIGGIFFTIFAKVRVLFLRTREVVDWLNKIINESILGAALIRVLHAQQYEYHKFLQANTDAKNIGLQILRLFASMIPAVTFISNGAILAILLLGGWLVIGGTMTLGEFAAFNNYVLLIVFPILILGFISNIISQASASYGRITEVLQLPALSSTGSRSTPIQGTVTMKEVTLKQGDKTTLKDISFEIPAGSKTAIIGPTAAGKTQLLYVLTGLLPPTSGTVSYDHIPLTEYDPEHLHHQVGIVFQDSITFHMTLRENIAFNTTVSEEDLWKAITAAELKEFVDSLPEGLDTLVTERGTSLSGGQKQRLMLARALALNPQVLFLDDFTARVDIRTEQRILSNISSMYPALTLISVTQKISSITSYDQILLLVEGELLARGTHEELLHHSPEYAQIYQSQRSTNELHAQ